MPWWLIEKISPYIGRPIGIQPQPDKYRRRNYDNDKRFSVEEQLISGNRVYTRTYNTTPGEKQDTTISVRTYPTDEPIGVYRSPYYNGNSDANEPMDVDSWDQVNNKIDAGKRNLILGRQSGGDIPSKYVNKIKNISKNKTYYGGELNPDVVTEEYPENVESYYDGELDPAIVTARDRNSRTRKRSKYQPYTSVWSPTLNSVFSPLSPGIIPTYGIIGAKKEAFNK